MDLRDVEISVSHDEALTERLCGASDKCVPCGERFATVAELSLEFSGGPAWEPGSSTTVRYERAPSTAARSGGPLLNTSPW